LKRRISHPRGDDRHLVFTQLHTNDAVGGITRFLDMDVEKTISRSSVVKSFIASEPRAHDFSRTCALVYYLANISRRSVSSSREKT